MTIQDVETLDLKENSFTNFNSNKLEVDLNRNLYAIKTNGVRNITI